MPDDPKPEQPSEDLVTLEITLRTVIDHNGRLVWEFVAPQGANNLEMLGLLAAGTQEVYSRMARAQRR